LFDYTKTEIVAGAFVVIGLALVGYLSISIGGLRILPQPHYVISARFANVGDLKVRAPVKVAGVTVGQVQAIRLADYFGEVELGIARGVALPRDSIASITTAGLLGDAFVSLSPGGDEQNLRQGERLTRTEPALNVADIIGRYAFGSASGSAPNGGAEGVPSGAAPPAPPSAPSDRPISPVKEPRP
jgi:phospholipid/cholesterol/gamma-HCH transport system substrate-binding protein